jgi:hypothetical protein
MKTFIILVVSCFLITSCMEDGRIKVQNKVHNARLDNISFGKVSIYYSLLPGQTSDEVIVSLKKEAFPVLRQLEFYMENDGNKVYLKTKNKYRLDYGETLLITISDSTEVINPLLQ